MATGLYRASMYGLMQEEKKAFEGMKFGGLEYSAEDPIFNAVYIKGKDKLVYWSTLDGKGCGAVYKELPTGARSSENPKALFKEKVVIDGKFPESGRGREILEEFAEYVQGTGEDKLMHSPVFELPHSKSLKRAREYVNIKP